MEQAGNVLITAKLRLHPAPSTSHRKKKAGNALPTKQIGAAVHTRGSPLRDMVTKLEDGPPN